MAIVQAQLRCCWFEYNDSENLRKTELSTPSLFIGKAYCTEVDLFYDVVIAGYTEKKYFKKNFYFFTFWNHTNLCSSLGDFVDRSWGKS